MPSLVPRPESFRPSSASFNRDRRHHRVGHRYLTRGALVQQSHVAEAWIHVDHGLAPRRSAQHLRHIEMEMRRRLGGVGAKYTSKRWIGCRARAGGSSGQSFRRFGLRTTEDRRAARWLRVFFEAAGVLTARLYPKLPTFLRFAAASLRGHQLQQRRYGPHQRGAASSKKLWSGSVGHLEQWRRWTERPAGVLLHHAAERTCRTIGITGMSGGAQGDRASPEILQNWPILSKQDLRENPPRWSSSRLPGTCSRPVRAERRERRCACGNRAKPSELVRPRGGPGAEWNGVHLWATGGPRWVARSSRPSSAAASPSGY